MYIHTCSSHEAAHTEVYSTGAIREGNWRGWGVDGSEFIDQFLLRSHTSYRPVELLTSENVCHLICERGSGDGNKTLSTYITCC